MHDAGWVGQMVLLRNCPPNHVNGFLGQRKYEKIRPGFPVLPSQCIRLLRMGARDAFQPQLTESALEGDFSATGELSHYREKEARLVSWINPIPLGQRCLPKQSHGLSGLTPNPGARSSPDQEALIMGGSVLLGVPDLPCKIWAVAYSRSNRLRIGYLRHPGILAQTLGSSSAYERYLAPVVPDARFGRPADLARPDSGSNRGSRRCPSPGLSEVRRGH